MHDRVAGQSWGMNQGKYRMIKIRVKGWTVEQIVQKKKITNMMMMMMIQRQTKNIIFKRLIVWMDTRVGILNTTNI